MSTDTARPAIDPASTVEAIETIIRSLELPCDTTPQARLCDCTDGTHPYRPSSKDWEWKADVASLEDLRLYFPGRPHVRYRTVVAIVIEGAR